MISSGATQVSAGGFHSLALKSDGSLWATGHNGKGQLGDGTATQRNSWTSVMSSGVIQVAAGYLHSLGLKSDGTLWKVGTNKAGQLGYEGDGSLIWMADRFFEKMILESLLNQSGDDPDVTTGCVDDWRGLSL